MGRIKIKSHWLDKDGDCSHIYGAWCTIDEGGLFYYKDDLIKDMKKMCPDSHEDDGLFHYGDLEVLFRYCPICGKKLIVEHGDDEVTIL